MSFVLKKDYRDDKKLRESFNCLAEETFGLSFEDWYQNGFWGDNYNPHSIVEDDKVIANVSVNKTDMLFQGEVKHFLQLGTVMTDKKYRNRGLIRMIMQEIEKEYSGETEGIYLFANDSVSEFYPKFGFREAKEYVYSRKVKNEGESQFEQVLMHDQVAWRRLLEVMDKNVFHGRFDMIHNNDLIMFYVTNFMQGNVYYEKETETFIIAEVEEETMFLHNVFSKKLDDLNELFPRLGENIEEVVLGFTPQNAEHFEVKELIEEDTTFFVKGEMLEMVEREQMRIPSLSRA